jgi:flavin reductase (DIM6/NTAB) family NADH-FMN oxidoreductase RutF
MNVDGKPNYITVGLMGWICYDAISVSIGHKQYSNQGIKQNGTFSVNQPSAALVKRLDFCGLYSGRQVDKAALFSNFYGSLKTAPMIDECPVNIECRVIQTIERKIHTVFIGEVETVHVSEECLSSGFPDAFKINPILYVPDRSKGTESGEYRALGGSLGQAWQIGKDLGRK